MFNNKVNKIKNFRLSMKNVAAIVACFAVSIMFSGCGKDNDDGPNLKEFTVQDTKALNQTPYADETAGTNLTFTTTGAWTSTVAAKDGKTADWVSIDPKSGTEAKEYTVNISFTVNKTGNERSAVITLTCKDEKMDVNVTQAAKTKDGKDPEEKITLTFTPESRGNGFYLAADALVVDWGDGTEKESYTKNSWISCRHTYSDVTKSYTVTITGENITMFGLDSEKVTSLDVSKCPALLEMSMAFIELTTLDISKNTALTALYFDHAPLLTSLDVSKNIALTDLVIAGGSLTGLDVTNNTALKYLLLYDNQFTAAALNSLFGTLHSNSIAGGKSIYISNNPGTATCDKSIAEGKGWTVNY
jgi:hypothetical protein